MSEQTIYVPIDEATEKRIALILERGDLDPNLPRAWSVTDVLSFAVTLMEIADRTPMSVALEPIFMLAMAHWEHERGQNDDE